jgi:hypothetical protein
MLGEHKHFGESAMTAKKLIYLLASLAIIALLTPTRIQALDAIDYAPPIPLPDVYITALQAHESLDYVELYNSTSGAMDMRGWSVRYGADLNVSYCSVTIDRVLLTKDYGVLADPAAITVADPEQIVPLNCAWTGGLAVVGLFDASGTLQQEVIMSATDQGSWVRQSLTGTYNSNVLLSAFRAYPVTASQYHAGAQVWTGGWYVPPASLPNVRIVEILPRPQSCSPTEASLACADYVKLWVGASVSEADLAGFALRTDSGGLSRTSSNGADLANFPIAEPGYITVPIALSNDGGYVWIDDIYGAQTYDATVIQYPSAEAAAQEGAAWALDPVDSVWKWTSTPRPDAPNNIYLPPEPVKVAASSTSAPCREGQERNPATNRCRSIVDAIAELVPCREGQERNPDTNRCRSVLAASSGLVPCAAGQERNPETNRCRKVVATADDIPLVTDVPSESRASRTGWIVAGVAVVGAGAYALYEWRDVLRRRLSLRRK